MASDDSKKVYIKDGKFSSDKETPDYKFISTSDFFSPTTNLIPQLSGVSGNRVLLGDKASLQAISLVDRQTPLVQSRDKMNDIPFVKKYAKDMAAIFSDNDGEVTAVDKHKITVGTKEYELYDNYLTGQKSFLDHTPVVKIGQKIKKGDLLATSNFTDKEGNLALGTNLTTAVMPFRSNNFEDAYVISETGAKKLIGEQMIPLRVEKVRGLDFNKDKFISLFPNVYLNDQISKIDSDGVIKKGSIVNHGDPLILAFEPRSLKTTDAQLGNISSILKNAFSDKSSSWDYESPGEIVDVAKTDKLVTLTIKTRRPMSQGDKLCLHYSHQVLTVKGWKFVAQITQNDEVYSLNPGTEKIELAKVSEIHSYDHDGLMYEVNARMVNMSVTPNHRLYAKIPNGYGYKDSKYQLIEAEKIAQRPYKLKNNGNYEGGKSPEFVEFKLEDKKFWDHNSKTIKWTSSQYAAILGMYLSEGNKINLPKHRFYAIQINQHKERNLQELYDFFNQSGIKYTFIKRGKRKLGVTIYGKALLQHFEQFGLAEDKFIPREVFSWNKQDLEILFKWLVWGDGSFRENGISYHTSSRRLAEDVQQLAFLLGYCSRIVTRPIGSIKTPNLNQRGQRIIQKLEAYTIRMYLDHYAPEIKTKNSSWKNYSGKVYCITLDKNHIFYTKRDEKCHWTGNSIGFGAKGVTVIKSDSQMPTTKDGKPIDIILNSMSIVSRIAPSLMTTIALGKVAQKTGKPVMVDSFDNKSLLDLAQKTLKEHNISEQEEIYDPVSGKHIKVTVGPLYFNRLHHISEDKVGSRGQGISYTSDEQPSKSNVENSAKRIGNLATNTYLTHNARHLLEDIATIRSTRNDEYWRKLKLGEDLPPLKVPFIFNKFIAHLEGAGIKVNQKGSKFNVLPQTNKDIEKLSKSSVENPSIFKIKAGELIPEKGGLFDPDKTGVVGENYNHINLENEVLNPITEEYVKKVLGLTANKFETLLKEGKLIDEIKKINVDKKIAELESHLKSKRKTDRNNTLKALLFLKNLKTNDIKPTDLILNKIPVIPSIYRPLVFQNGKVISSGINELYRDVMLINHKVDDLPSWMNPGDIRMKQYNAVKAVYGLGAPVSAKNEQKGFKGLLASALGLQGGSAKESMFQSRVVNKPIDLVSRAVLVPDAVLDLDQVGLPQSAVWKMYTPFVIKRLVESGLPPTYAKEYVDNKHPLALEQLSAELKERPALVSRDPQLNPKYSHMGFFVKMNPDPKDTTLKLNPLVFKMQNSDCDGDQLNASVPVSLNAVKETIEKLLPSKNLVIPRNLKSPAFTPSNESALGLYLATTEDKKNKAKEFNSIIEMKKAFHAGEIDLGDRVHIKK